jgi:hypothetical protein
MLQGHLGYFNISVSVYQLNTALERKKGRKIPRRAIHIPPRDTFPFSEVYTGITTPTFSSLLPQEERLEIK